MDRGRTRGRRKRAVVALSLVVAIGLGAAGYSLTRGSDEDERADRAKGSGTRAPASTRRQAILQRVRRGYFPKRSGDVLAVERLPNQFGTRHSTPWPYTQNVPLVLYGPGFIKRGFSSDRNVTLADIAPTYADLLGFDGLGERDGQVTQRSPLTTEPPKRRSQAILTLVWDGGGDNMLEQWPDSWPHLKSLMAKSASFDNATVGSSPSITPSTHATLGTGFFPSSHGLTDIPVRIDGRMVDSWDRKSPRNLRVETLADLWDRANGNAPLVGLLARDSWHAGMMGHGSYVEGGDKDISVLDALGKLEFTSNTDHYSFPAYAASLEGLEEAVQEVDLHDGEADREWLGNPMYMNGKIRETPAWSIFQTQKLLEILETEGFGMDDIPDLFFTNYKPTDLTGHSYNLVEPEVKQNLEEQDRQLKAIVDGLDDLVGKGNYVLALTADHGVTPYPEVTGGWSINTGEVTKDLEREFNAAMPRKKMVTANRGYQFFFAKKVMRGERRHLRGRFGVHSQLPAAREHDRCRSSAPSIQGSPERTDLPDCDVRTGAQPSRLPARLSASQAHISPFTSAPVQRDDLVQLAPWKHGIEYSLAGTVRETLRGFVALCNVVPDRVAGHERRQLLRRGAVRGHALGIAEERRCRRSLDDAGTLLSLKLGIDIGHYLTSEDRPSTDLQRCLAMVGGNGHDVARLARCSNQARPPCRPKPRRPLQ